MYPAVQELAQQMPLSQACRDLGVNRSHYYRWLKPPAPQKEPQPRVVAHPRRLKEEEKAEVLAILHSPEFQDRTPYEVYGTLLDEQKKYLCSTRTMYRLLQQSGENQPRGRSRTSGGYQKPELLATAPNQLWSWDITKLKGAQKLTYYYLYVILDVFSRYVVGWHIAPCESAAVAQEFIASCCLQQNIQPGQLTIHADRGSAMTSKGVGQLLADLGVEKSHSRPYTSNDNPFSEAQFKTLKYQPDYPERFGSLADARTWARPFFHWYNEEHRHTRLALMTPAVVQAGLGKQLTQQRQEVLAAAYKAHPERFVRGLPQPLALPTQVWINPPTPEKEFP